VKSIGEKLLLRRLREAVHYVASTIVLCSVVLPAAADAQGAGSGQRFTRAQVQEQLAKVNGDLARAKSGDRGRMLEQISVLKGRLENGDFKPGDRFVLSLRQDSVRTDTLVVRDSLRVAILNLPEFSIAGVLRSELEDKLNAHVARFLRNAVIRTTLLTRVSVTGAVRNPGFYYAVPDRPINDLLTSAGGPLPEADLSKLNIARVGRALLRSKDAKRVVEEGRTLEALDVQSGDTVHVPLKKKINWQMVIQLAFVAMSLLFAMLQFLQWYYNRQDS
jgi:hypothetical protein